MNYCGLRPVPEADDTLAAIAAMIAARNSCMHSWRQGVPDTLAAMTTAVNGSDYTLSCYLDTVRDNGTAHPPRPTTASKLKAVVAGLLPWVTGNFQHAGIQQTALIAAFKPPFRWVHELRAAITAAIAASVLPPWHTGSGCCIDSCHKLSSQQQVAFEIYSIIRSINLPETCMPLSKLGNI